MNNSGSCWQVTFAPLDGEQDAFENFLEDFFEVVVCNFDDDGQDVFVGYKGVAFKTKELEAAAAAAGVRLPSYRAELLESQNWLKDYVIEYAPVEVADFLIYGIHEKEMPQTDKLPLRVYAATAFGSEHPTTKACLEAISRLNCDGCRPLRVLDMGCGSGILSLAAAKLWGTETKIIAADIDEEAVIVTRMNAEDNGLSPLITAVRSDGYADDAVRNNAPYDLVLANILARPLIAMAPELSAALKPGGFAVLSGFVADQAEWVIGAHEEAGLRLKALFEPDDTWRAALMEKTK